MNRNFALTPWKRAMIIAAAMLLTTSSAVAQNTELQQKVAAVKDAVAANKQRLQQYQWTETTQLTLKGAGEAALTKQLPVRPQWAG